MKKPNDPKVKFNFDGCYNYKRLEKEGLIDTPKTEEEFIKMHTEDNPDAP